MSATCPGCGRELSEHDRHIRFTWPDRVLALGQGSEPDGVWMSHDTATESMMMSLEGVASFVRVLVPVRLTGGYSVTFGAWLAVPETEMRRAFSVWFSPEYSDLNMSGQLANELPPWKVLGAQVSAEVREPDHTPYAVSSDDASLSGVLSDEWDHELVLSALPR